MEKLKSLVPYNLMRMVADSSTDDLPLVSSSLLDFFRSSEQFHRIVSDLSDTRSGLCGKNKDDALELKRKGNQLYMSGDYSQALSCYTQALRVAPVDAYDMDKNLAATLYVNRASLLQKMDLLVECLHDCNRALQISPSYAKAWYRRGKVNASLKNYEDAVRDFIIAKFMESSLGGKRQIDNELNIISDQNKMTIDTVVLNNENNLRVLEEPLHIKLQCVTTPDKGRGMTSQCDIREATLVHREEPYALILLKHYRETHCFYCLNELPADAIPCISCSIPLYCSCRCLVHSGGQMVKRNPTEHNISESLFNNLEEYLSRIILGDDIYPNGEHILEHKHECHGAHWPIILPSDIALAGRVLVKSIKQARPSKKGSNLIERLDLSHNYSEVPPEGKMEFILYSIVLLYCLQSTYANELPICGASISQVVILISQIRVNSMAIVRMKSHDYGPQGALGKPVPSASASTSTVEQVRVGQAIYKAGSLFNHSCQPNIHTYFLSRTLMIRATEFVASGCPLELSYGPQVGQWDHKDRVKFLEDEYFFRCHCRACFEVNISDLVLNAYCCVNLNCPGVVLESSVVNCEKEKLKCFTGMQCSSSSDSSSQVDNVCSDHITSVASLPFEKKNMSLLIAPGYCLKCGSYRELESLHVEIEEAWIDIRRLQDAIILNEISSDLLSAGLRSLGQLRSIFHAYNKGIAEAEDYIAQAFCLVGDLQCARDHCKASIEILEKLYGCNHIVIGYELVKLSSIQLSMADSNAVDNINRLREIFACYYGSHADVMFPYLQSLQSNAEKLVHKS